MLVRVAGEHRVPLWPHGQGRNNGYGGAAPRLRGTVTVSLRRMNRVLEINEEMAYAVVEPGVSWAELYQAIQAGGQRLMLSIPDLSWGSVVGNSLRCAPCAWTARSRACPPSSTRWCSRRRWASAAGGTTARSRSPTT